MKDIAPELLELLQEKFNDGFNESEKILRLNNLLEQGKASYKEANELAIEVGEILAKVFRENLSSDILPDGKMYYNIAQRIIEPTMKQNYELISAYAADVQKVLNTQVGISLNAVTAEMNQDRINNIINRVADEELFDDIKWILDEPVINFSQAIIDDTIKANADFHYKSGLKPKIIRNALSTCCKWCSNLEGKYDYPHGTPRDVYRRHRFCRCTVDYHPGDGKIQNIHDKKWIDPEKEGKIEIRKQIGIKNNDEKALSSKKWYGAEFSNEKKLDKHLDRHLNEYGDITKNEYLNTAKRLLAASTDDDVEGFISEAGFIFKYRNSTNDFVIGRPDGKISTLFKPDEGIDYWKEQIELYKKKED